MPIHSAMTTGLLATLLLLGGLPLEALSIEPETGERRVYTQASAEKSLISSENDKQATLIKLTPLKETSKLSEKTSPPETQSTEKATTPADNKVDNQQKLIGEEAARQEPVEMVTLVDGTVTASLKEVAVKLDRPTLIGLVAKQNLDVRIAESKVRQAQGAYLGSYGNLLPTLRGQLYVERFSGGDIFIREIPVSVKRLTYRPRVMLDYQLPLGGKPLFQIRAAKFRLEESEEERAQALQTAFYEAMAKYYEMIRDRMKKVVTEQSLAGMEMLVKVNEARLKSGFGTRYEVEQARVQLAERQDRLLAARNQAANSAIDLASTLNLPVSSEFISEADVLIPVRFLEPETPMNQLLELADANRPDLKRLAAEIREARAVYQGSFSDLLPTLAVTSYYGGVGPKTNDLREAFQRGIALNVDLLRNMGVPTLGTLKTNRARIEEVIGERQKRVNEIHKRLAAAYYDWQRYAQQIHVMKRKADAAEEAYRLAMARFKTGFGIQLEVLQAQTDYTDAIQEIQTAIFNYNNAQLSLLLEAGRLTPETILLGQEQTDFFKKPVLLSGQTGNQAALAPAIMLNK